MINNIKNQILFLPFLLIFACNSVQNNSNKESINKSDLENSEIENLNPKANSINNNRTIQGIDIPSDQKNYEDEFDRLWKEYRKASGNTVLEDEAYNSFLTYAQSINYVNDWILKISSVDVVSDGTWVIDCYDEYKEKSFTLLLKEIPNEVLRKMPKGTKISITGKKYYDRLNGQYFKGIYNADCSFKILE